MEYKQFCPVAKAAELLGDRWTLLIVRELLMGGSRFNELQRGLARISPTMLTKRLVELAQNGLVIRKRIPGQKGYEYFLSQAGKEVDIWFDTDLRTMIEVWMGDRTYRNAISNGQLKLRGPRALTRNVTDWMANAMFASIPAASAIPD